MTADAIDAFPESAPRAASRGLSKLLAIPAVKIALIGLLLAVIMISSQYVAGLIQERDARQTEVLTAFQRSWGPSQSVLGPVLVVPYQVSPDKPRRYLHIAPSRLAVKARLTPELRKRGMFHAIVYGADLDLNGTFQVPREEAPVDANAVLLWQNSFVIMSATDLRAMKSDARLAWNGQQIAWGDCAQGGDAGCGGRLFVAAYPHLSGPPSPDAPIPFETKLSLRGTQAFRLTPLGKEVEFSLQAPWSTPSFVGAVLPASSKVAADQFEAVWHVSSNVATGNWMWASPAAADSGGRWQGADDPIGVELQEPVPTYRTVDRASKYAVLFLALSFLTYFLFEMTARLRIHLVQYGLLGLSVSLFALLLISFSEPLGFTEGYALSALLVLAQASLYTATVTRRPRHALTFAAVLAALFGFLYIVISLETYALLVGSIALFLALSIVMMVTRRLDWSGAQASGPTVAPLAAVSEPSAPEAPSAPG